MLWLQSCLPLKRLSSKSQVFQYFRQKTPLEEENSSSQPPCLTLGLEQGKNVALPHWALDVPDNLTVALSDELNLHLGTLTLGASPAQNLDDPREGDAGLVHADALLSCRSESSNKSL